MQIVNKNQGTRRSSLVFATPLTKTGARTAKGGGSGSLATEAKITKEYIVSGIELTNAPLSTKTSIGRMQFDSQDHTHAR